MNNITKKIKGMLKQNSSIFNVNNTIKHGLSSVKQKKMFKTTTNMFNIFPKKTKRVKQFLIKPQMKYNEYVNGIKYLIKKIL